jgi:large subunit ribosomal protein L21
MSYAIIKTGGKQFSVEAGQIIRVPTLLDKNEGDKLEIETMMVADGSNVNLSAAAVKAVVLGHGRADKIIVFKKKRRKTYRRTKGHRQNYTEIQIESI